MAGYRPMSEGHYFERRPQAPSRPRSTHLSLPDLDVDLATDAGVFSAERVDAGTKYLLLEAPTPPAAGHLADVGCGYGPIALTLAQRSPAATVWAVDVNERARDLCRANAADNDLGNVRVAAPAEVPADVHFEAIWSNPPIRIGKAALHDLLASWLARLTPEGKAVLVVQKHLGADSLQRWLADQGWSAARHSSRAGYRLLEVARR